MICFITKQINWEFFSSDTNFVEGRFSDFTKKSMNLVQFIKDLSPSELRIIAPAFRKKNLVENDSASDEANYFNLVLSTSTDLLNDKFIQDILQKNDNAYKKLKGRVLTKILEKFCSEKFINDGDVIDGVSRVEVRIKKRLLQVKILYLKKAKSKPDLFLHLLNEIIEEAKEYELYNSIIEALTHRKHYYATRIGISEFEKIEEEINYYGQCLNAANVANNFYYKIISNQELISNLSEKEIGDFIDTAVKALESSPYTTISTRIQYIYKLIKLAQLQKNNEIAECINICLDIISLLKRSKAVEKSERFGHIYANLSQCLLLQRSYQKAAQAARESQIYFPHESFSFVVAKEQEFFATFYSKNYTRCRETLQMMLSLNTMDAGKLRLDKYTYFSGCLDFVEGKFREANRISNLALQVQKDKSRWDLGMRYLKIMSLIELKEYEDARNAIESFRKQIERSKDGDRVQISSRDKTIYKALNEYRNQNFDRSSVRLNYLLRKLGLKNSELSWKYYTHEVIPIHKWLLKDLGNKNSKTKVDSGSSVNESI